MYLHWRHYLHLLGHDDDHSQIFDEKVMMIWYNVVLVVLVVLVDDSKYSFDVGVIPVAGIVWIRRWACQGGTGRRGHLVSRPTLFVWCVFFNVLVMSNLLLFLLLFVVLLFSVVVAVF